MMLPTHVLAGLAIATPIVVVSPDHGTTALFGALVGSIVPDLDMYWGHRRSLHYPTGYTLVAVPAAFTAVLLKSAVPVALAFVLIGASLHCRMDRYGGGLELRPWEATSDRAVYDHVRGRWRKPKRWIRYDGAPEDVLIAVLLGTPLFVILERPFRWLVVALLLIGVVYGVLRRRLAALAPVVFDNVPKSVSRYVPDRYRS